MKIVNVNGRSECLALNENGRWETNRHRMRMVG